MVGVDSDRTEPATGPRAHCRGERAGFKGEFSRRSQSFEEELRSLPNQGHQVVDLIKDQQQNFHACT